MAAANAVVAACFVLATLSTVSALTCNDVPKPVDGKRCYVCRATDPNDPKDVCLRNPELVTPGAPCIPCKKKFCTIFRKEDKSTGDVIEFFRSCEDDVETGGFNETAYTVYYSKCTIDKCNKAGDGTSEIITIGDEDFFGEQVNVVVPGILPKSQAAPTVAASADFNWKAWAVGLACFFFSVIVQRVPAVFDGHIAR